MKKLTLLLCVCLPATLVSGQVNRRTTKKKINEASGVEVRVSPDEQETQPTPDTTLEQLTAIAQEALNAQYNILVHGERSAALNSKDSPSHYREAVQERTAELAGLHKALVADRITYAAHRTALHPLSFQRRGNKATLIAVERTVIDLKVDGGPATTESVSEHSFTFVNEDGLWRLTSDKLINLPVPEGPQEGEMPVFLPPTDTAAPTDITRSVKNQGDEEYALMAASSLNRTAVVNYAVKYWSNYNPSYRKFGNDCTNFASQALYAGGWQMVGGFYQYSSAWWYNSTFSTPGQTCTWAGAHNFYWFTYNRPRGIIAQSISDLVPGDILQVDWNDASGKPTPDGHIDHTMIVTKKDAYRNIYLTQHSTNRLNKAFTLYRSEFPNAKWYGWRMYLYPN